MAREGGEQRYDHASEKGKKGDGHYVGFARALHTTLRHRGVIVGRDLFDCVGRAWALAGTRSLLYLRFTLRDLGDLFSPGLEPKGGAARIVSGRPAASVNDAPL